MKTTTTCFFSFFAIQAMTAFGADCFLPVQEEPGKREYLDDFYFAFSGAEGAPGEVVPVDLSLTVEALHGSDTLAATMVASYDIDAAELLGEPEFPEDFDDYGWFPEFFLLQAPEGRAGFLIGWIWEKGAPDYLRERLRIPLKAARIYFRIKGAVGQRTEVTIEDNVLGDGLGRCVQNMLSYYPPLEVFSRRHVPGEIRIVDREPILTEPPPQPPDAKIYPQPLTNSEAGARFALSGGSPNPDGGLTVDLSITSDREFVGYLVGGKFPADALALERIEVLTTPGPRLIDNDRGEFGILSSNLRRRMGAEGEPVIAARLHFRPKEGTRTGQEVRISLEDVSLPTGEDGGISVIPYRNMIRVLGKDSNFTPVQVEVAPITLGEASLLLPPAERTLRGDSNFDTGLDLSNAIATLEYLFLGGAEPRCPGAADFDRDGRLGITDPIGFLATLFLGAPPPGGEEPRVVSCR